MSTIQEQYTAIAAPIVGRAFQVAEISLESTERFVNLQIEAAKASLKQANDDAKELIQIKDLQGLLALRSKVAGRSLEQFQSYYRDLYELDKETRAQFAKIFEEDVAVFKDRVSEALDRAAKSLPAGAEAAVSALKSAIERTSDAVESFTKVAKQVAEITDNSVQAVASASAEAVKPVIEAQAVAVEEAVAEEPKKAAKAK